MIHTKPQIELQRDNKSQVLIKTVGDSLSIGVRERMFEEFDKYISEFAAEDFTVDYWYDEGVDIAENMLREFAENDWKA